MSVPPEPDALSVALRRESTAEQVAAALGDLIIRGRLAPGAHLPEGPLSTRLGVSRNTVREATQILVRQGLVRRELHHGAYVAELGPEDVRDVFRVRRLVELAAAREIAGRDVSVLQEPLDALADAVASGDVGAARAADLAFHRELVSLMASDRLGGLFAGVDAEMQLAVALAGDGAAGVKPLLKEDRAVFNGLRRGRPQDAVAALERHLEASERRLLAALH
jgi:DNA-binding GntR family transcriptional regulator